MDLASCGRIDPAGAALGLQYAVRFRPRWAYTTINGLNSILTEIT
jgi:hypothetical protein